MLKAKEMKYLLLIISVLIFVNCKKNIENTELTVDEVEVPTSRNAIVAEESIETSSFEINQYFETFIAKNEQQTEKIELTTPQHNEVLTRKADKVKVEIKGYWNKNDKQNSNLSLEVFPNQFAQNTGVRPIIEQKLKLNSNNDFMNFSYLKFIKLESGLYYYFLKDGNEVIYVDKFIVK